MEKIWKGYPGGSYDFSNLLQFYFFISLRKPKWSALLSNIWIAREAEKGCRHSYAAAQMWARLEMSFGQQISQRVNQSDCGRLKFQSRESKLVYVQENSGSCSCKLYTAHCTAPALQQVRAVSSFSKCVLPVCACNFSTWRPKTCCLDNFRCGKSFNSWTHPFFFPGQL